MQPKMTSYIVPAGQVNRPKSEVSFQQKEIRGPETGRLRPRRRVSGRARPLCVRSLPHGGQRLPRQDPRGSRSLTLQKQPSNRSGSRSLRGRHNKPYSGRHSSSLCP